MSAATAIAQVVTIIEGTPVASAPKFQLDKTGDPSRRRRFAVDALAGARVVDAQSEGRHVIDVDVVIAYEPQRSNAADRHQRTIDIITDVQSVTERLVTTANWNRPTSGIKRITVAGRESIAYRIDDGGDETPTLVRFSFPLEHV